MKNVVRIQIVILGVALAACSGASRTSSDISKKLSATKALQAVGQNQSCPGTVPAGSTIEGTWVGKSQDANDQYSVELKIEKTKTTMTVNCVSGASVTVDSSSQYDGKVLSVFDTASTEDATDSSCNASLEPKDTSYKLVGNCLEFTDGTDKADLVRQQ
jgi:hypothetical protein